MAMALSSSVSLRATQVGASNSSFQSGSCLRLATPARASVRSGLSVVCEEERLRLNNMKPLPGSRRKEQRKGRGRAAGQGLTCGYGNRGQKSRSGGSIRPGFEGGQMPTYRAMPKLRGICGGMSSAVPKFVTVNLKDIESYGLDADTEVTLETLKSMGKLKATGADRNLPLKVLGEGDISVSLNFKAAAFSASALAKIEAAGGKVEKIAPKKKWTRAAHEAKVAAAAA
mmetsp:Transcript_50120/g.95736  ORF Transcript_50120/g.95736 Transcript_50120/m.95736 type:complete len:228 (-) Transcript_50120:254-937(-)